MIPVEQEPQRNRNHKAQQKRPWCRRGERVAKTGHRVDLRRRYSKRRDTPKDAGLHADVMYEGRRKLALDLAKPQNGRDRAEWRQAAAPERNGMNRKTFGAYGIAIRPDRCRHMNIESGVTSRTGHGKPMGQEGLVLGLDVEKRHGR